MVGPGKGFGGFEVGEEVSWDKGLVLTRLQQHSRKGFECGLTVQGTLGLTRGTLVEIMQHEGQQS